MNDPVTLALVFVGGAGGSAIRWLVGMGVGERYKGTFPLGTFLINVSGAFLMGFLSTLFNVDWRDRYGSNLTAFVLTGVLGGYTTFSSYQLDTANLYNKEDARVGHILLDWLGGCRSNRGRARRHNSQVVRITRTLSDAQGRNSRIDRRRYRRRCA